MNAAADRLKAIFKNPGWDRFISILREYRDAGRSLPSVVSITDPTSAERERHAALLRLRKPSRAGRLAYELDKISTALVASDLPGEWSTVLEHICGPIPRQVLISRQNIADWDQLWPALNAQLAAAPFPGWETWFAALRRDGTLKKLAGGDAEIGRSLLSTAAAVLRLMPLPREQPLAQFAAQQCGNSHALDPGTSLATLVLRGLATRQEQPMPARARERRDLWAAFKVICDELSAPVLTFNLTLGGEEPVAHLATNASNAGQPLHLSTRLLLATDWSRVRMPSKVFVCENPAIVALAATALAGHCAPLVCVDGEPKTAAWLLLRALRKGGATLHYHGDFDWPGMAIARRILDETGALPWRFDLDAYLAASKHTGRVLEGFPVETQWSPGLKDRMLEKKKAIDEESVADILLEDLRLGAQLT